jgi:hypothetical protein
MQLMCIDGTATAKEHSLNTPNFFLNQIGLFIPYISTQSKYDLRTPITNNVRNHMKYIPFIILLTLFLIPETSSANERRFGYTTESSVLPVGAREIELWHTDRRGRGYFYQRIDQRVEYEFGVTDHLMSALYLNVTARSRDNNGDVPGGSKSSSTSFSISNEWKLKLTDRVADPFGTALYGELTIGTDKEELEAKFILDKQFRRVLFAADLVAEYESTTDVVNGAAEAEEEFKVKTGAGAAYLFDGGFGAGVEVRLDNIFLNGELEHSSIFAGPVLSYSTEEYWATLTFLPQVRSFKGGTTSGGTLDLGEFEQFQTRLLFSFHL